MSLKILAAAEEDKINNLEKPISQFAQSLPVNRSQPQFIQVPQTKIL